MKNKFIVRLGLMFFLLMLFNCRTDDYSNQKHNHENQFQNRKFSVLNRKQIESIDGLLQRVQNVEKNIVQKEIIGNSFSKINQDSLLQDSNINIDSVLLIEHNGLKTYTFKISRNNNSSTIENLVLRKNTDSTFSGVLMKYDLTDNEKQMSASGHSVDLTNKIQVFPIENLSIQARVVSQTSGCYTVTWETGVCSGDNHPYGDTSCNLIGSSGEAPRPQIISVVNKCTGSAVSDISVYTDGDPGGSGGFDTGVWGGGSGADGEPITTTLCEELELRNLLLKSFLGKPKTKGRLDEISLNIATNTAEKSFSFGITTGMGKLEAVTPIKIGPANAGMVGVYAAYPNMIIYGIIHTHPKNSEHKAFSGADFFTFADSSKVNSSLKYYLVKAADGSVYALSITDRQTFLNFFENKSMDDYINNEREFKIESNIGGEIYDLIKTFMKNEKSKNEAYELALAFVLKKYNMGLGFSKMDTNGDFKPIFVNETTPNPQKPKKKHYEQTDNCNL